MKKENYTQIPLEKVLVPKDGDRVYENRWWIIKDECVLLYRGRAPQCNANKSISVRIRDKIYPGCDVRYFETIFLPLRDEW